MVESVDLTEKTLSREDKFKGKILDVHVDHAFLPASS